MKTCNLKSIHIYPSPILHESRIFRETKSLYKSGLFTKITIIGFSQKGLKEWDTLDKCREIWRVPLTNFKINGIFKKILAFLEWYFRIIIKTKSKNLNFINCHSVSTLPLCVLISFLTKATLIYDTHELETETQTNTGLRKIFVKIVEKIFIKRASAVFVVSDSIMHWYKTKYNLNNVYVIKNIPEQKKIPSKKNNLMRKKFNILKKEKIFIYQGVLGYGRGIETLLKAFSYLKTDYHIIFLGYGNLSKKVVKFSKKYPNIHYHPPVLPSNLILHTSAADIGISLIENVSLSYYYCLPNKVFEYLMSGLPIIVSNFPDMSKLISKYNSGWTCNNDYKNFIKLVNSLSNEEIQEKKKSVKRISNSIGWHTEESKMMAVYHDLLGLTYPANTNN